MSSSPKVVDASLLALRTLLMPSALARPTTSSWSSLRQSRNRPSVLRSRCTNCSRSFSVASVRRQQPPESTPPAPSSSSPSSTSISSAGQSSADDDDPASSYTGHSVSLLDKFLQPSSPTARQARTGMGVGDSASDTRNRLWALLESKKPVPVEKMQNPFGNPASSPFAQPTPAPFSAVGAVDAGRQGRVAGGKPYFDSQRNPPKPNLAPMRLTPAIGRTVDIVSEKGIDLATGLRRLARKLNDNNLRRQLVQQRHHERPGLRRKRLKSERWRKRFLKGFLATIEQVRHMRKQGW